MANYESAQAFGSMDLAFRVREAETALAPGGMLHGIAQELVADDRELTTAAEVGDVLLPQKGGDTPRFELLEDAPQRLKALVGDKEDDIIDLAVGAGLRATESMVRDDLERVGPNSRVIEEAGARNTFVTRADLAEEVMSRRSLRAPLFKLVAGRVITELRPDGTPNPEREIVTKLVGDLDVLSTHGDTTHAGVASAILRAQGYQDHDPQVAPGIGMYTRYTREGSRDKVLVKPLSEAEGGTVAGLTAVDHYLDQMEHPYEAGTLSAPVIVTNGQYRTKDQLLAREWELRHKRQFGQRPVVFGDEPGRRTMHNGMEIATPKRPAALYVPELVIVARCAQKVREAYATRQRW